MFCLIFFSDVSTIILILTFCVLEDTSLATVFTSWSTPTPCHCSLNDS